MGMAVDWSPRGRARVWFWTVVGSLACIAIAMLVDYPNFISLDTAGRTRAILVNIFLPLSLAAPAIYVLTSKIRELAIAQEQLTVIASTDSLTAVLNRGAFTLLIDAYLTQTRLADDEIKGALLVVDADNFKSINDRYGHDQGDVALKLIAQTIKSALRGADIVGRIGGEEFGVFLPGSDTIRPEAVAERIRRTVEEANFYPGAERRPLSVSVGGAVFASRIDFKALFRLADQQLYVAKQRGRNQVIVQPVALAA